MRLHVFLASAPVLLFAPGKLKFLIRFRRVRRFEGKSGILLVGTCRPLLNGCRKECLLTSREKGRNFRTRVRTTWYGFTHARKFWLQSQQRGSCLFPVAFAPSGSGNTCIHWSTDVGRSRRRADILYCPTQAEANVKRFGATNSTL